MKTELEKRIIVAEACGIYLRKDGTKTFPYRLIGPRGDYGGYWSTKGGALSNRFDTIDSIRSAVMQQSEEFKKKFCYVMANKCHEHDINYLRGFIQLTPIDWLNAFVETVEGMK